MEAGSALKKSGDGFDNLVFARQFMLESVFQGFPFKKCLQKAIEGGLGKERFAELAGVSVSELSRELSSDVAVDETILNRLLRPMALCFHRGELRELRELTLARQMVVVDDFYDDPDSIRRLALEDQYKYGKFADGSLRYSGFSNKSYITDEVRSKLPKIVGTEIKFRTDHELTGHFRVAPTKGPQQGIHIHWDEYGWNAIVYLNLPEHCEGGTGLYRHRRTGWEIYPTHRELKAAGFESFADMEKQVLREDQRRDPSNWEHILTIPMKYNRLLIIRSDFWHARTSQFGDQPENRRMVQTFFVEPL
jgi:hypothetical protein